MSSIIIYAEDPKTKFISEIISEKISSECVEIKEIRNNKGFLGNILDSLNNHKNIEIKPKNIDLSNKYLILIGCQSHFGRPTPSILKFIKNNDFKSKNVIIFTTTTSRSDYDVLKALKKEVEKQSGNVINSFIMRVNDKNKNQLRINTIKLIKELDLDLYD